MVKRHHKGSDGNYHIAGHTHEILIGSRAQVMHGTAHKTSGNLTKSHLMFNKHGRIVSRKKHATAKRERRLEKAGYKPKKGKFVLMRKGHRGTHKRHGSKTHKRKHKKRRTSKRRNSRGRCHNKNGKFVKC